MKTGKKVVAVLSAAVMTAGILGACGNSDSGSNGTADTTKETTGAAANNEGGNEGGSTGSGSVYYLNYKPEVDQQWQELAASYTEQTGVPVTVVTAASGTYE